MSRLIEVEELEKKGFDQIVEFDEYGYTLANSIMLSDCPTVDAIVIPENPTNRDMIKAVFKGRDSSIITERLEHTNWLDAPYKKEG